MNNMLRQMQRSKAASKSEAKSNAAEKPERVATGKRIIDGLKAAVEMAGDDCSNPTCPYRDDVMAARERNRQKVARYRANKAKKAKP